MIKTPGRKGKRRRKTRSLKGTGLKSSQMETMQKRRSIERKLMEEDRAVTDKGQNMDNEGEKNYSNKIDLDQQSLSRRHHHSQKSKKL